MTAPVTAPQLAERLAGLGLTWDTCKRLDAHSNTHPRPPRPEVGSRVVLCDGKPRRVPLDELEVVR